MWASFAVAVGQAILTTALYSLRIKQTTKWADSDLLIFFAPAAAAFIAHLAILWSNAGAQGRPAVRIAAMVFWSGFLAVIAFVVGVGVGVNRWGS